MKKKKITAVISWVPRRLRVGVFLSKGRLHAPGTKRHGERVQHWIAADLRGYHVGQGDDPLDAIRCLLWLCRANDALAAEEKAKGGRVVRDRLSWRCQDAIEDLEKEARKNGFIIDGVEALGPDAKMTAGFHEKLHTPRRRKKKA